MSIRRVNPDFKVGPTGKMVDPPNPDGQCRCGRQDGTLGGFHRSGGSWRSTCKRGPGEGSEA